MPGLSGHVPYWRSHLGPDVPQWINLMGGEQGGPRGHRGGAGAEPGRSCAKGWLVAQGEKSSWRMILE